LLFGGKPSVHDLLFGGKPSVHDLLFGGKPSVHELLFGGKPSVHELLFGTMQTTALLRPPFVELSLSLTMTLIQSRVKHSSVLGVGVGSSFNKMALNELLHTPA
jgi:hypothetical protein